MSNINYVRNKSERDKLVDINYRIKIFKDKNIRFVIYGWKNGI